MSKRKIEDVSSAESSEAKRLQSQLDEILADLDATHQRKILASLDPDEIVTLCNESERWRDACQAFPYAFWKSKMQEIFGAEWKQKVEAWYKNPRALDFGRFGFGPQNAPPKRARMPDLSRLTFDDFVEIMQQFRADNSAVFFRNRGMRGMGGMWAGQLPIPVPQD